MKREIAILALAALIVLAAGTPASAVFAFPSGPTELRAQACNTEAASEESGTFSGNCAGTYPAACATDKISCNDATAETATTSENNQFMGIKASAYNATVGNCAGITSVKLCYEWWSSSNKIDTCRVKVDANGGGSFSTASSACPGTSANPGEICADVTALETWTCPNFFNATGTRALAFLEAESSTDSSKTLTVDDLYFNVTYTADSTPPAVAINYPRNVTYNSSVTTLNSTASDANLSACWYSLNRGVSNASFACNANVTGLAPVSGINIWTVWANDSFGNLNSSTISFSVNQPPVISNATVSPNPIAGSTTITIYANATANGVNDSEANSLDFYCGTTSTPTAANTNCTGGTTSSAYPYALSCTFTTESASGNYTKYCRVYDGNSYSPSVQANYAVNATPLSTTIASVAGDTTPSYIDTLNDGVTSIIVSGETGMSCRWGSSDLAYYSMNNSCTTTGMQANCPVSDVASQGFTTRYVSCQNALGIGQNSTNNLDVAFYLDYTAPTTSDNSNTSVNAPPYSVTITESDNVDGNPTTLYCTDTAGTCIPGTSIDNGGTVTFNSSNRGRNYFRYYSTDFAGNVQATQNKTININQLPAFTSSTGTTGTILGGTTAAITTTSSDPDAGQNLRLYVCSSSGASSSGCAGSQYCTALSASNPTCAFASETNTANHAWYAYLYDELGEGATSNPLTGNYSTDSTPPAITVTTPANATYNTGNITLSIITSEAASSAWYSLEGGANATMSNDSSTHWNKTLSALSDGTHSVTFYANDSVGNVGSSPAISFSIDKTPPSITILSPANGSYRTASNVPIIISSNEALSWAGYRINGGALANLANTTTTNWNATISLADESTFNLTIYANDTAGNQGNATITFYTDSLPPRFTATTVTPNPANETQNATCSSFVNDTFNLSNVKISENQTLQGTFTNHTINLTTAGYANYTLTNTTKGNYACTFYATDAAGNANSTQTSFTINDVTPPTITLTSPTNTTYNTNNISITINTSEAASAAWYNLDATTSQTLTNTTTTNWNANPTSLPDGLHYITIHANDTSANTATTNPTYFTIDTTPPAITITTITNASYQTTTALTLNITTNEDTTTATYSLNNGPTTSLTNTTPRNWTATLANLPTESANTLTVHANDTAGNQGNATITFYTDTLAPRFTATTVTPNPANSSQSVNCSAFWNDTFNINPVIISHNANGTFQNNTINFSANSGFASYLINGSELANPGNYTCIFYATDAAGNTNTTQINFTVREVARTAPVISSGPNDGVGAVGGGFAHEAGGRAIASNAGTETVAYSNAMQKISGKDGSFDIEIYNANANLSLKDLTIEITGRLRDYVTTSPVSISLIKPKERGKIKVRLNVPPDEEISGQEVLKTVIRGKLVSASAERDYVQTRDIRLVAGESGNNQKSLSLSNAEKAVSEMQAAGFNTSEVKGLLKDASLKLSKDKRYDAQALSQKAIGIKLRAFEANEFIRSVAESLVKPENQLQASGNPSSGISKSNLRGSVRDAPLTGLLLEETSAGSEAATKLLAMAIAAFENGDYDAAYGLAKSARASLPPEKRDSAGPLPFGQYWPYSLFAALAVLCLGGFFAYRLREKSSKRGRMERMDWEADDLRARLSSSLRDYILGELSEGDYHSLTAHRRARLETIRQQRQILGNERENLLELPKVLKRLGNGPRAG